MLTTIASHHPKIWIEQIFAMASVWHTIIYNLLENNVECSVAVERKIFAVTCNDLTIPLQTLLYSRAIRTFMLN